MGDFDDEEVGALQVEGLNVKSDYQLKVDLNRSLSNMAAMDRQLVEARQKNVDLARRLLTAEKELAAVKEFPGTEEADLPDLPDAYLRAMRDSMERFAEGYAEYGQGAADALGLAGQWGDLHRKVMKLKRPFWAGENSLTRENADEILHDIIGHCLLALEMMERGFEGGRS
jgi:hypothetical protein